MTGCKEGAPEDVTGGSRGGSAKTCKPPPEETCKGAALPRTVCSSEVLSAVHIRWRDGRLDESIITTPQDGSKTHLKQPTGKGVAEETEPRPPRPLTEGTDACWENTSTRGAQRAPEAEEAGLRPTGEQSSLCEVSSLTSCRVIRGCLCSSMWANSWLNTLGDRSCPMASFPDPPTRRPPGLDRSVCKADELQLTIMVVVAFSEK
ncbi:uncharacterized protein [Desmodus rotundus]|uniref:uncharacterized protein n=1 Tax=Desmodus rotundus TaxID=9430 RepID=UPI0023817114|nr:uncharacterized protein LOC123480431 [Desmodus rotundus]